MKKFESVRADEANYKWEQMIQRKQELYRNEKDMRTPFERDYTRILNCNAYKRLKHKTQVFYSPKSEHICTRAEHCALVESISYTIANNLGLNIELTKAIATAHDLGHPPFGHCGETIISKITKNDIDTMFWHEKNGLDFIDDIELLENEDNSFENLNLTYALRDGVISHCGEVDENGLKPRDEFIDLNFYLYPNQYRPFTWEACVVKIADKISYVTRDIQDAMKLGLLDEELKELKKILDFDKSINNTNIIHYLIADVCNNSSIENGLMFSDKAFHILNEIKKFNYKYIYFAPKTRHSNKYFELVINEIYNILKECYDKEKLLENILNLKKLYPLLQNSFYNFIIKYYDFDNNKKEDKENNENIEEKLKYNNKNILDINNPKSYYLLIIYYIAGMTDNFAKEVYESIINFELN